MATTFDLRISLFGENMNRLSHADACLSDAHQLITRLEHELTEFLPESPIAKLNQARLEERIIFTDAGMELLEKSFEYYRLSNGAFDCLAKSKTSPSNHSSRTLWIQWDSKTNEVWKTVEGAHLGFGAIGKGYALDRVRTLIEQAGFKDYLLSAGGSSLILSGLSAPGEPWQWGWSWIKSDAEQWGQTFQHPAQETLSIGVSGVQEKGLHLISSDSKPAPVPVSTLIATRGSAAEADALSTAAYISGWDKTYQWLAEVQQTPALAMIDHDQTPRWNGFFQHLFHEVKSTTLVLALSFLLSISAIADSANSANDVVDLSDLGSLGGLDGAMEGTTQFTPYLFERQGWWILLPIFALSLVLIHLRNNRFKPKKGGTP